MHLVWMSRIPTLASPREHGCVMAAGKCHAKVPEHCLNLFSGEVRPVARVYDPRAASDWDKVVEYDVDC
jgi:hypothetical protein